MSTNLPLTGTDFLRQLAAELKLSPDAVRVLQRSGARSPEAVLSLLETFPNLALQGLLHAPSLSNAVFKKDGPGLRAILHAKQAGTPPGPSRRSPGGGHGALPPPNAHWQVRDKAPWTPGVTGSVGAALAPAAPPLAGGPVDVRGCLPWAVRDQGGRGTCVAFGVTALREQLLCRMAGGIQPLSEQFFYWDIKTNTADPNKTSDGTWIQFAFDALRNDGISLAALWPYNPVFIAGNISQAAAGVPPPSTIAAATAYRWSAATYARISATSGNAQLVLNLLRSNNRPVAICLPVFADPAVPQGDNWETAVGWNYGLVLDPPPTATVQDGHCVCVTGFVPDASEPLGGYFVIRNSWSTKWGALLPAAGYVGPEAGYGQISASYVDQYLWEYGQL